VSSLDVLLSEGGFLPYTIVRTLSDGQQVLVGACEDLRLRGPEGSEKDHRGTEQILAGELRDSVSPFPATSGP